MLTKSKKITIFVIVGLGALAIGFVALQTRQNYLTKRSLSVEVTDKKGIFVEDSTKFFTEKPGKVDQEIDYVWDQMHTAGVYEKQGKLIEAAEFYKKAVQGLSNSQEHIIPGRSMAGKYLIDVYEKLGEYDRALEVVDWLESIYVAESGKKYCAETRTRLLAAKAHSQKT